MTISASGQEGQHDLVGDGREGWLVGQELVGDAVDAHRIGVAAALRIDVVVQLAARAFV